MVANHMSVANLRCIALYANATHAFKAKADSISLEGQDLKDKGYYSLTLPHHTEAHVERMIYIPFANSMHYHP